MKTENNLIVVQPKSLNELDNLLKNTNTSYQFIGGGTDLLVQEKKWETYNSIVDLKSVKEISSDIFIEDEYLYIGAANCYSDIIKNKIVVKHFPILIRSLKQIGSVQIQNRGTLGGNICNASPAGDSLPVLSVLDADLLIGPKNNYKFKVVPFNNFYTGFKTFSLLKNEYIAYIRIKIPIEAYTNWYFRKVGQRFSMAISKVSLAMLLKIENNSIKDIKLSTGSVKPYIKRETEVENYLLNKELVDKVFNEASEIIKRNISPISDIRSIKNFREYLTSQLLKEALFLAKDVL